jgi:hypothetical protein
MLGLKLAEELERARATGRAAVYLALDRDGIAVNPLLYEK